jgi:hypothetical protein
MTNPPLHITFNCNNYTLPNFRYVEVDGEAVHRISDIKQFYEALGYSDEINKQGILHDEFIWDEYLKDGSSKCDHCLKAKLVEYLKTHSMKFVEKYGSEIDQCLSICPESEHQGTVCRAQCGARQA